MNKRDFNKRISSITNNAEQNSIVNKLIEINYQQLYQQLVKTEADKDLFHDTYLILTNNYNPSVSFVKEFCRQFRNLKMEQQKKQIITVELNANTEEASEE